MHSPFPSGGSTVRLAVQLFLVDGTVHSVHCCSGSFWRGRVRGEWPHWWVWQGWVHVEILYVSPLICEPGAKDMYLMAFLWLQQNATHTRTHACTHACTHTRTHTRTHTPDRVSEEDLLQVHSALTEGLSCVIKFLLVIAAKEHPPEELVRCSWRVLCVVCHMINTCWSSA